MLSAVGQRTIAVHFKCPVWRWGTASVLPQAGSAVEHRWTAPVGQVYVVVARDSVEVLTERHGVSALLGAGVDARRVADLVTTLAVYGELVGSSGVKAGQEVTQCAVGAPADRGRQYGYTGAAAEGEVGRTVFDYHAVVDFVEGAFIIPFKGDAVVCGVGYLEACNEAAANADVVDIDILVIRGGRVGTQCEVASVAAVCSEVGGEQLVTGGAVDECVDWREGTHFVGVVHYTHDNAASTSLWPHPEGHLYFGYRYGQAWHHGSGVSAVVIVHPHDVAAVTAPLGVVAVHFGKVPVGRPYRFEVLAILECEGVAVKGGEGGALGFTSHSAATRGEGQGVACGGLQSGDGIWGCDAIVGGHGSATGHSKIDSRIADSAPTYGQLAMPGIEYLKRVDAAVLGHDIVDVYHAVGSGLHALYHAECQSAAVARVGRHGYGEVIPLAALAHCQSVDGNESVVTV